MKAISLLALASALVFAGTAEAAPKRKSQRSSNYSAPARTADGGHNMAGCGLGSMVVEDQGKWAQVGASLLNGTGMQTFAISFGTSGCTEDGVAEASREKDAFVEANFADLRRDIAVGSGAYLSSLASLYGCSGDEAASFGAAIKKHENAVLDASAEEASSVIDRAVAAERLSCQG